ncbi:hypothetical protein FAGAP_10609 [Fusarium agapanthi]|uniref:Uncharacterized protein n=1 Tax=Fusarium agapanthi TaxID=1803897 RepID=A0A9P5E3U6_9HYPO|nr:hypothetical protein FAGAP_10609 [Fusarium agapanthi]
MLAELCIEHGDILDLEYEMRTEEGMKRLLTGSVEPQRDYTAGGEWMPARENESDPLAIKDKDMDKMTNPELIGSLARVDMAIYRINGYRERLNEEKTRIENDAKALYHKNEFGEKRLKTLKERHKYLKSRMQ